MILRWYVAYNGIFKQQSLHFRKQNKQYKIKINKFIIIIKKNKNKNNIYIYIYIYI